MGRELRRFQLGDLGLQHQPDLGILVAQIDVDVGGLDHPGGDQHAFEETVGILLEVVAVLEGAGLALVAVDGHQARRRLRAHQGPFASGGKPGTAEPAQTGVAHRLDHVIAAALAGEARFQQRIAAVRPVGGEILGRLVGMGVQVLGHGGADGCGRRPHHLDMADGRDRGAVAGADAGRTHHPHIGTQVPRQIGQQLFRTGHSAGQAVAHPHGDRGRRRAVLHHVEMGVEGRDLVDLGLGELHLGGECGEMCSGEVAVTILQEMQVLDQEIAPARAVAQERAHLVERARIGLAPLRLAGRAAARLGGQFGGVHAWTIMSATGGCLPRRRKKFVRCLAFLPNSACVPRFRTGRRSCRRCRRRWSPRREPWAAPASS